MDETAFIPSTADEREALARKLVRAMIAAANADGTITSKEKSEILSHLKAIHMEDSDRQFVEYEFTAPLDINAVVKSAETPEHSDASGHPFRSDPATNSGTSGQLIDGTVECVG